MNRINKILTVDNNATNLEIMQEILEDDFILTHAISGEIALELLDSFKPDLVLLDILTPDINGIEICHRIKSSNQWKHIRVIIVTGRAMPHERKLGMDAGADNYLTKPFSMDEILNAIKDLNQQVI